jgi:hypothetical protein
MKTTLDWNARSLRWIGSFALAAAITACGGGGGGGDDGVIPPAANASIAANDTFPAVQSSIGGSTTPVQLNDSVTINSSTTAVVLGTNASIAAVTRTSAAPAAGSISFNTSTGVITVAAGTSAGAYSFSYQLCLNAPNQAICSIATASGTITTTPPASNVVTRADILACPPSNSLISTNAWSNCLVGKIFVGRDTLNSNQACELRVLANAEFQLVHNGVTYNHLANSVVTVGLYQNSTADPLRPALLLGVITRSTNPSNVTIDQLSDISISIDLNGTDTLEAKYLSTAGIQTINCTFNNI